VLNRQELAVSSVAVRAGSYEAANPGFHATSTVNKMNRHHENASLTAT
jgi:hypothetical protein